MDEEQHGIHDESLLTRFFAPQILDSDVISLKDDKKMFEVKIDISGYQPKEVSVTVLAEEILVEGRHEECNQSGEVIISQKFVKKYNLPQGVKRENVMSRLSKDRILTISAHKEDNSNKAHLTLRWALRKPKISTLKRGKLFNLLILISV